MNIRKLAVAAIVLLSASVGMADIKTPLSIGYSNLQMGDGDKNLDGASGIGIHANLNPSLYPYNSENVRLLAGVGFSYFTGDGEAVDSESGATQETDSKLYIGKIELGVSYTVKVTERFYIEPGVSGVAMLGRYEFDAGGGANTVREWKGGWGVEPQVKFGWKTENIDWGLEGRALFGQLKISEDTGSDFREYYVGAFLNILW